MFHATERLVGMQGITSSNQLLASGGIETYLIFLQGVELREFCGFDVYRDEAAVAQAETDFLTPIANSALASGRDLLLDALTWRAHGDYLTTLGYGENGVTEVNQMAVGRTRDFVRRWQTETPGSEAIQVFINGDVGPRGDGYRLEDAMTLEQALSYHRPQIEALAAAGADAVNALTMTHVNEAAAIALASREVGLPCIVSPTVEVDGTTPDGQTLGGFIEQVEAKTNASPLYYMVNCAHPYHLEPTLRKAGDDGSLWLERFRGFRANASRKSHAELDNCAELDRGQPDLLGTTMATLLEDFNLKLIGGCCGTDAEHIGCMATALGGPHSQARAS